MILRTTRGPYLLTQLAFVFSLAASAKSSSVVSTVRRWKWWGMPGSLALRQGRELVWRIKYLSTPV